MYAEYQGKQMFESVDGAVKPDPFNTLVSNVVVNSIPLVGTKDQHRLMVRITTIPGSSSISGEGGDSDVSAKIVNSTGAC
jgi:hypothetical protein